MITTKTHKFVIDTASDKIGRLVDQLKSLRDDEGTQAKAINQQIMEVFSFLESYIKDMKSYKIKLEEDIQSANRLMETKLDVISSDVDSVESRIKTTPQFSDKDEVNDICDSLNQINLGIYQAGEKAKEIRDSIDLHIKNMESFIKNKTDALSKMGEIKNPFSDPDVVILGETSNNFTPSHCDIEMESVEFYDFVHYLNSNDIEISDIEGETDDGQVLFINGNDKIRPPLDVIVDKELTLNITSGSVKMISKETGNTVWRDIEDYIDDFREMSQTSHRPWEETLNAKTFISFLDYLAQNDINVVSINGKASDGTRLWVSSGSVPYSSDIHNKGLSVYIENGSVEKNGIYYDIERYFYAFKKEGGIQKSNEGEGDAFLKSLMDLDEIPDVKDEKFFSKLRLQGKLFADMIEKIDNNDFSFYMLDAVMQTAEGEEKISINSENVLCPSEEYVRKNANHVVVNKAAVKTNTGEMIGLMEALVLLD